MGTIFLVIYIYIHDSRLNRPESVSLASLARQLYVTESWKRDHFADLLESRYRRLNSDNNNKTFFADLSFLLANGSRIFPLPLYQILSFVLFSK